MAIDLKKRQKKLAKRNARRKEKRHVIARAANMGLRERLADAARYPVLHCNINESVWDEGMGNLLFSRQLPDGRIAFTMFLIDMYCLGVKDAFGDIATPSEYDEKIERRASGSPEFQDLSPEDARKLVESAVAFARGNGFQPHPDYRRCQSIFGDVDADQSTKEYEFGRDGKPVYIAGPNDSLARSRRIIHILQAHTGPNGSDFVIPQLEENWEFDEEDGEPSLEYSAESR